MDPSRYVDALFAVLQGHAPTSNDKQVCSGMLWALQNAGESDKAIQLALASALVDGLRFGNWPWKITPPQDLYPINQ